MILWSYIKMYLVTYAKTKTKQKFRKPLLLIFIIPENHKQL